MQKQLQLCRGWFVLNGAFNQYAADAVYMEMIHQLSVSHNSDMNG